MGAAVATCGEAQCASARFVLFDPVGTSRHFSLLHEIVSTGNSKLPLRHIPDQHYFTIDTSMSSDRFACTPLGMDQHRTRWPTPGLLECTVGLGVKPFCQPIQAHERFAIANGLFLSTPKKVKQASPAWPAIAKSHAGGGGGARKMTSVLRPGRARVRAAPKLARPGQRAECVDQADRAATRASVVRRRCVASMPGASTTSCGLQKNSALLERVAIAEPALAEQYEAVGTKQRLIGAPHFKELVDKSPHQSVPLLVSPASSIHDLP